MANDNNNINELVADDDDPTVELETAAFSDDGSKPLEVDAITFDAQKHVGKKSSSGVTVSALTSDLESRDEVISRLQYDIERLRAKSLGLESEIGARDDQTKGLHDELASVRDGFVRKEKLIKKRDGKIKALKSEIRQRDNEFRQLTSRYDDLKRLNASVETPPDSQSTNVEVAVDEFTASDLQHRLSRSEEYADSIRQQSQDLIESNSRYERENENLTQVLSESRYTSGNLNSELAKTVASLDDMRVTIDTLQKRHEQELRNLRFELGEAQDTIVETGEVNYQLTSDLVDARGFKDELETMLGEAEEQSSEHVESLQKEIKKLNRKTESLEQKLSTKSEAISILLAELAKKSGSLESIDEIENVAPDINEHVLEGGLSGNEGAAQSSSDRTTRVLIGSVDGQVLRFPLFKDRLTIGRTKNNDIQLKAAYVSRRHAVIQTDGEQTRIIDWGSKNGIQVNSARVSEHFLQHGDTVLIGNARFRYEERRMRGS